MTLPSDRSSGGSLPRSILACSFLATLGAGLYAFIIPLASFDERVSGTLLGGAFAAYYLARLIVSPLSGAAADRLGPRPLLISALSAGALAPLAYFFLPTLETLFAIQILLGLVSGLVRPVIMTALGRGAPVGDMPRRFAWNGALFQAAIFMGPLIGGMLYLHRSMEPVLFALAGCMGAAAVAALQWVESPSAQGAEAGAVRSGPVGADVPLFPLLLAIFGRTLGIGLLSAFYPVVLATILGRNGTAIGFLFAVPGLAAFCGLALAGRFSNSLPTMSRVAMGMVLSAVGLLGLGWGQHFWQFLVFGIISGAGAAISIPSSMTLANLFRRPGAAFGAAHFASGLGLLVGPLLGGVVVRTMHAPQPAFQMAALVGVLCCVPLAGVALTREHHWGRWLCVVGMSVLTCAVLGLALLWSSLRGVEGPTNDHLYRFTNVAMGTIVNLTLEADNRMVAADAAGKAVEAMRSWQWDLDFRNAEGSVGLINHAAGVRWVKPSARAYGLLQRATEYSRASGGVFDPTVGAVTTSPLYYALDASLAESQAGRVDYRKLLFDLTGKRVMLKDKGMALDLGGIAKGTIIDAAVNLLRGLGIRSGIVEAGGDFYCFGPRHWKVGVQHPREMNVFTTVSVREKGVCGSGDYRQFVDVEEDGETVRRHHIVDPSTLRPAADSVGVTVIAGSAEQADALATTLFIMGPVRGLGFLKEHYSDVAALWFRPDMSVVLSSNFPK